MTEPPQQDGRHQARDQQYDAGHDRKYAGAGLIQVPEGRRIFPNLSVRENLEIGSYRRGRPHRAANLERVGTIFPRLRERMKQLAGTLSGGEQQMLAIGRGLMAEPVLLILDEPSLGLAPLMVERIFGTISELKRQGRSAGTLSGGEQQMLAIGRGLMAEPRLLILDEPSLGLSPLLVEEMFALVAGLRAEGLSVLLVEQNVTQSLAIADRAYVLEQGQFTLTGAGAVLLDDPRLRQAYLGL